MNLGAKRNAKKIEKRKLRNKEKKKERVHYFLLILAMLYFIVHYMFFEKNTIGHDVRYSIYVFWIPLITGILFFGIYRRDFLLNTYRSFSETYAKIYVIGFYLLQGIFVSYLSFGQIANTVWNYINKREASRNRTEIVTCNVTRFYAKKNPDISFEFKNGNEIFDVTSEMIRQYRNSDPKDYQLEITVQKGIWNYYVVKHWELKKIH